MKFSKNALSIALGLGGALLLSTCSHSDSSIYHLSIDTPPTKTDKPIYHLSTDTPSAKTDKPDFAAMTDVKEKKQAFIKFALVGIDNANKEICAQKKDIDELEASLSKNGSLNSDEKEQLQMFAQHYKIQTLNHSDRQILGKLNHRIGTAPQSFVLAQAILESGWGTSRFATDNNNYFGLHCFDEGCGVKATGANVYMETFRTPGDSVLGYYHRLNTGGAFTDFRKIRFEVEEKSSPDGSNISDIELNQLLSTLHSYSELGGDEYKDRLLDVIKHNNLREYDSTPCQ